MAIQLLPKEPSPLELAAQARADAWDNFNPRQSHRYPQNDFVTVALAHSKYHKAYVAEHGEEPSDPITNCITKYSSWQRYHGAKLVIERPGQPPRVPSWVFNDLENAQNEGKAEVA